MSGFAANVCAEENLTYNIRGKGGHLCVTSTILLLCLPDSRSLPRCRFLAAHACLCFLHQARRQRSPSGRGRQGGEDGARADRQGQPPREQGSQPLPAAQDGGCGAVPCRASLRRRATSAMIVTPPRVRCGDAGRDKIQASLTIKQQLLNSTRAPFGWLVGWLG